MRFAPREADGDIPEGLRYIGQWPRSEKRSVADRLGGWFQDCMVKVGQGAWIFLLTVFGLVGGVLTAWSLPASLWWWIISLAYFAAVLYIPARIILFVERKGDRTGVAGSAIAFIMLAMAAVKGFDLFIWEALDQWTRSFFTFKLPVLNGWGLLMLTFFGVVVISVLVKNGIGAGGGLLGTFGSLAMWLWTCEFTRPGLMFYTLLAALDAAYLFAAFGVGVKKIAAAGTVGILQREQADVYEPYGSETPPPPLPQALPETRFVDVYRRGSYRGLEPVDRLIHVTGPKSEEWVTCERNLRYFVENLTTYGVRERDWRGVKMPSGLLLVNRGTGELVRKDAPITQWAHWAVHVHFLAQHGIYNVQTRRFAQDVVMNGGQPNPELILYKLGLLGDGPDEPLPILEEEKWKEANNANPRTTGQDDAIGARV